MLVLARLIFLAICLFMFINLFLNDYDDRKNSLEYKIYIFLFIFVFNLMFQIFSNLINKIKINMGELIETSTNNALLSVVAFGVYGDLNHNGFFNNYDTNQKTLVLILLIIGFIATIKILELLIGSN